MADIVDTNTPRTRSILPAQPGRAMTRAWGADRDPVIELAATDRGDVAGVDRLVHL